MENTGQASGGLAHENIIQICEFFLFLRWPLGTREEKEDFFRSPLGAEEKGVFSLASWRK